MPTINQLPLITQLSGGDNLVVWAPNQGDSRRASLTTFQAWLNASTSISASQVSFIQDGAGAITRTSQSKMRDIVCVDDYDTLQNAVNSVFSANQMILLTDVYAVTTSINNLHSVRYTGLGGISRGGNTFYPNAVEGQTNTLYVATTGNDANDGITVDRPFATIQRAFDVLEHYGSLLDGTWVIQCAAGTYDGAIYPDRLMSTNRVVLKGPDVSRAAPTMIIDGTSSALTHGLYFNDYAFMELRDFIVRDFTDVGAYGILFNRQGWDVNLHNVRCIANDNGAAFIGTGTVQWQWGGAENNASIGIVCQDRCRFTLGWGGTTVYSGSGAFALTDGLYIKDNGLSGVDLTRQSYGYLRYSLVENSYTGMAVNRNTRVRNLGNTYLNNTNAPFVIGPMAMSNSSETNTLTGNGNNNEPIFQGFALDGDNNAAYTPNLGIYALLGCDVTSRANPAGTARAEQVPSFGRVLGNILISSDAMLRVNAKGTISKGTTGTYTIWFYTGGQSMVGLVIPAPQALSGDFTVTIQMSASSSTAQVGYMQFTCGSYTQQAAIASSRDFAVNRTIAFWTERADVADSTTFTFCSAELAGWTQP